MTAEFFGVKVKIPAGYTLDSYGNYINGHGVEYTLVEYGSGDDAVICLETIYSKHVRTIPLERVQTDSASEVTRTRRKPQ